MKSRCWKENLPPVFLPFYRWVELKLDSPFYLPIVSDSIKFFTSQQVTAPDGRMETLQECLRALRKAGAKTPECTSRHVHVGEQNFTARQIANIVRIFYKQDELILKAAWTLERRLQHCSKRFLSSNKIFSKALKRKYWKTHFLITAVTSRIYINCRKLCSDTCNFIL